MGLLTIGAFARAVRLTPKALRLYDELGLLPPAAVDPESGYRLYDPGQIERGRLIGRLRRIGMPLAGIRAVCGLEPAGAAEAVSAYWQQVTADMAARGQLAASLVEHLSGRGNAMSDPNHTLGVRYAAACVAGDVRRSNEDCVYAGDRLLAVADGTSGPGGAAASSAAVDALRPLEFVDAPAAELLTMLAAAVERADREIRDAGDDEHPAVTTLTALLRSGSRLALVHIGDTRAYLLRDGELHQLTHDHTYVQSLVDRGQLDREAAASHRQRALLARALGAGPVPVEADLALRTGRAGDRYLLCSDGLSAVVPRGALRDGLTGGDPEAAVQRLIGLAHAEGAPDNVACVVADLIAT